MFIYIIILYYADVTYSYYLLGEKDPYYYNSIEKKVLQLV